MSAMTLRTQHYNVNFDPSAEADGRPWEVYRGDDIQAGVLGRFSTRGAAARYARLCEDEDLRIAQSRQYYR